jgi:hypothetical protein
LAWGYASHCYGYDSIKINDINSDDKEWNAPLLYQIVTTIRMNNSGWLEYPNCAHFCYQKPDKGWLMTDEEMCFHNYSKKYCKPRNLGSCKERSECYTKFDNSVFYLEIQNRSYDREGFPLWLYDVGKYDTFQNTVLLILEQYRDLAQRLDILHNKRRELIEKYNDESLMKPIDNDIMFLSSLGMQLGEVTKQFFELAKQDMTKIDIYKARSEAMHGLKSFSEQIDQAAQAASTQSKGLEEVLEAIKQALQEYKKAINE